MGKFSNLFKNELFKLFKKKSTIIMFILIPLIVIFISAATYMANKAFEPYYQTDNNWKINERETINGYEQEIERLKALDSAEADKSDAWKEEMESQIDYYENMIELSKLKIANNIDPESWQDSVIITIMGFREEQLNIRPYDKNSSEYKLLEDKAEQYLLMIQSQSWQDFVKMEIETIKADNSLSEEEKKIHLEEKDLRLKYDIEPSSSMILGDDQSESWKNDDVNSIVENKLILLKADSLEETDFNFDRRALEVSIQKAMKRIETNTPPNTKFTDTLRSSVYSVFVVLIFMVVISSLIVSSEFTLGSIKFLVVSPHKRWKILLSKYVVVLTVALSMMILLFVSNFAAALITNGAGGISHVIYVAFNGKVFGINQIFYSFLVYMLKYIYVIVYSTFAFMAATILRQSAFAIAASLLITLGESFIMQILLMVRGISSMDSNSVGLGWMKYLLLPNADLTSHLADSTSTIKYNDISVLFSVFIILAYMAVFLLSAFDSFSHRDIKK